MKRHMLTRQSFTSRSADYKTQKQTLIAISFFQSRQIEGHQQPLFQYSHLSGLTARHCKTSQKIPRGAGGRGSPHSLPTADSPLGASPRVPARLPLRERMPGEGSSISAFPRRGPRPSTQVLTCQLQLHFALQDVCTHSHKHTGEHKLLRQSIRAQSFANTCLELLLALLGPHCSALVAYCTVYEILIKSFLLSHPPNKAELTYLNSYRDVLAAFLKLTLDTTRTGPLFYA